MPNPKINIHILLDCFHIGFSFRFILLSVNRLESSFINSLLTNEQKSFVQRVAINPSRTMAFAEKKNSSPRNNKIPRIIILGALVSKITKNEVIVFKKKKKIEKQTSINNGRTEQRKIGQFLLLNNEKERKSKFN